MTERKLTRRLPLVHGHVRLPCGVDDLHAREEVRKVRVRLLLGKDALEVGVELEAEAVLACESVRTTLSVSSVRGRGKEGRRSETHCTNSSQYTTYSGTSSTASWRKKVYRWPYRGVGSCSSNFTRYTSFPNTRGSSFGSCARRSLKSVPQTLSPGGSRTYP